MKKTKQTIIVLIIAFSAFVPAFSQFGKNKVQYREYDWKYIQTSNFDIYFYDEAFELAHLAAYQAEQSLLSIQRTLNYKMEKRVPIILYNSKNEFQQTNVINAYLPEGIGGVTELYKNRVVVPFLGDLNQFKRVIHHELVHAVLNNLLQGGTLQSAISTGNMRQLPIWMNEGLAEFESIGKLDTQTDMFLRDLVVSERLMDLEQIDGYFAYRAGQAFYWYITEKYGRNRIGELINKFKLIGRIDEVFKRTFNLSLEDFSEEWKKYLKRYYLPDIEKYKNPNEFSSRLTFAKKDRTYYNSSPSISPKGDRFAFISARDNGIYAIYIQDINNKDNVKKLISSFRQEDFEELNVLTPGISWNPDATQLAISAKAGGEDGIFIVNVENGKYEKLTFGIASITSVSWSNDGTQLAFVGSGPKGSDIYTFKLKSKELTKITDDLFSDSYPVWSWDNNSIFFLSDRGDFISKDSIPQNLNLWELSLAENDIFKYDLITNKIERITNETTYIKTSFVISPDNSKILYLSDKNGILNIYSLDLSSGVTYPITNSMNAISQLSITPNGYDLLFSSQVELGFDIYHLRDPFNIRLESDTIPNTKFRQSIIDKIALKDKVQQISNLKSDNKNELVGYDNFIIEFSRQKVVRPNPDAVKNYMSDYTSPINISDSNFIPKDYQISFSPDIILSNPYVSTFYGFQGSFQMLFSDLMGNHQLYLAANLWLDLKNSNILAAYSYLTKIINYEFSGYHNSLMNYTSFDQLYRFRNFGLGVKAWYPLDIFTRIEWGLRWLNLDKENVFIPTEPSVSRMLFVPNVRFVYDDVLWGYFAPAKGARYFIDAKASPKITTNGLSFVKIDFDYRRYFPIVTNFLTFVVRGAGGTSAGPNPQRSFLGGTENWINSEFLNGRFPFENPEDFVFEQIIMPMRGYQVNAINGNHYFLSNIELRFPIIAAIVTGPLPILIHSITGVGFMDIGGAWYGDYSNFKATQILNGEKVPKDLIMSLGVGLRSQLLGLPVKVDVAWRNEINNWSKPYYMFSLGYDF